MPKTKPPLHRLSKAEIVKMGNTRCKHGHTFLEHYGCYEPEQQERVGYLDIEASNLDADFGYILSWCIKNEIGGNIIEDVLTKEDLETNEAGKEDTRIVQSLVDALANYDRIVTYYGKRFDVPYIRTRAIACGIEFPNYGTLTHTDLYFVIKFKMKLSSNRLENATRVLLGKTNKTRIDSKHWRAGGRGAADSLAYILDHNRKDVIDLQRLYHKVINFSRKNDVSI